MAGSVFDNFMKSINDGTVTGDAQKLLQEYGAKLNNTKDGAVESFEQFLVTAKAGGRQVSADVEKTAKGFMDTTDTGKTINAAVGMDTQNAIGGAINTAKETAGDVDDASGNFFSKNGKTLLGVGIAAVVGMIGGPIAAILALIAALVIGAMMDGKDSMLGGLANNMFGDKKDKSQGDGQNQQKEGAGAGQNQNTEKAAPSNILIRDPATGQEAAKISGLVKDGKLVINEMQLTGSDNATHTIRLDTPIELKLDQTGKVDTQDNATDAKLAEILKRTAMIKGGDINQDGNKENDKNVAYTDHGLSAAVNKAATTAKAK